MSPFSGDTSEAAPPTTGPIRLIGTCLQSTGTPAFALHLLELAQQTGARQVMVFDLAGDGAR